MFMVVDEDEKLIETMFISGQNRDVLKQMGHSPLR